MTILLPDVSEFQTGGSAPDWAGIKAKNGGAGICRVGYGADHLDKMFVSNYTAMKNHGFSYLGLYHYLRAGQDPKAQAQAFCKWVGPRSAVAPGTVYMLDLEEGDGDQSGRANAWHTAVDDFYGLSAQPLNKRSWLYSYTSFVTAHNLGAMFASDRHTWIAAYQSNPPLIGHTLWQSTDGSKGSNITSWPGCGRCDTSVHNGTLATLAADAWQVSGTPPPPPPPAPFHGEYVTAGMSPLSEIAAKLGVPVSTLLRTTAVHYGTFGNDLGGWVSDVLTGAKPSTTPVPKGVKLWRE
jgi:hypothetical protein